MRLYHFTNHLWLPLILDAGISRGDVPTSPTGGFNAPWLTVDPEPAAQGWVAGTGKDAVRITVEVPDGDPRLHHWPALAAQLGVDPTWYAVLDRVGGGGSESWYVYEGVVPPGWFVDVSV